MPLKAAYDTPPSSDIEPELALPPSPPASPKRSPVDRLIGILHLRRVGRLDTISDWRGFKLSASQFEELERRIQESKALAGFVAEKVRWDYDPREKEYILRMPTAVHERFIALVEREFFEAIERLADSLEGTHKDEAVKALRGVYQGRSPTLELHAPRLENSSQSSFSSSEEVVVRKSPDATFFHQDENALPALVVEVSYSQQRKDLPRLAESYVVDSRHAIRCVVGLDITYNKRKADKTATVSVWRPSLEEDENGESVGECREDVQAVCFRNSDGDACDGALRLALEDILPATIYNALPETSQAETVTIPFSKLSEFLNSAESEARKPRPIAAAPKRFRKRKRSPAERLSDDRERLFLDKEEQELVKDRKVDKEWQPSGWRIMKAEDVEAADEAEVEIALRRSKRNKSGKSGDGG